MKAILETILELTDRVEWKRTKTGYVLISPAEELLGVVILIQKYAQKGVVAMNRAIKKHETRNQTMARLLEKMRPFAEGDLDG